MTAWIGRATRFVRALAPLEALFDKFPLFAAWLTGAVVVSVLSIGAAVVGVLGNTWSTELRAARPITWLVADRGAAIAVSPDAQAVPIFYFLLSAWSLLFFLHRSAVSVQRDGGTRRLERLVLRAPHRGIFVSAGKLAELAWSGAQSVRDAPPETRSAVAKERLRGVLEAIARFTGEFGGAPGEYGANVMLPVDVSLVESRQELRGRLRFFNLERHRFDQLSTVLCMFPDLTSTGAPSTERKVPIIALPVPHSAANKSGDWLALPGAPRTFLDGLPGIHVDLNKFVDDCTRYGNFETDIKREIGEYFAGEAATVKSFASFRVGNIGVLNVDCSQPHLLGHDDEFAATYVALLTPTLVLLTELVEPLYDEYTGPEVTK